MQVINGYVYNNPSISGQVYVNLTTVPVVEISASPLSYMNSRNASFELIVKDAGNDAPLPGAILHYKLDGQTTYTSLFNGRTLNLSGLSDGAHVVLFIAELDGEYSLTPTRYEWNVDLGAPSISSFVPQNNSDSIGVRSTMTIVFSEPMNVASVASGISFSPNVAGNWTNTGQTSFVYTPSVDMANLQIYTVTVDTTVKDRAGNALPVQSVFRFTTIPRANNPPVAPDFSGIVNSKMISHGKPRIVFKIPADQDNDALHFTIQFASNSGFTSGNRSYDSIVNASSFVYYNTNGEKVSPFPSDGVSPGSGKIVFNMPDSLGDGEYWYRVLANDRR
jgi:hypothetical protein